MAAPALSQQQQKQSYDLPAQDLKYALRAVARSAGFQLIADSKGLRGRQSKPLKGQYTVEEAVNALLEGSDLSGEVSNRTVFVRGRLEPSRDAVAGATEDLAIVITGSRIRGAPTASMMITKTQEQMREAGFTNLGDYARSVPQSFGGGQNPGVTVGVTGVGNENVSSASSLNLRGLGPDATLTILNGHRLAYNSVAQAIDISAIPLAAVDRVEIVTDGASAIYGSDAVAGVANIILKRSFSGIEVAGSFGAATDGGDHRQNYNAVAGLTGTDAGFLVTYDFTRSTAILAGQRSYTNGTFPSTSLLPSQTQHSAIATGYWEPIANLVLSFDANLNDRTSTTVQPLISDNYLNQGYLRLPKDRSFSISPKVEWTLANDWRVTAFGTLAQDKVELNSRFYNANALSNASIGSYTNRTRVFELNAEGALARLPGGALRLAIGGGYRSSRLIADLYVERPTGTTPTVQFLKSRHSYYGFAEAFIPLVSPDQKLPAIDSLSFSAAARFEDYGDMGNITTPKLGVKYSPVGGLDLGATWGRSFKTPTLYQQFQAYSAQLVPTTYFGAVGYPVTAATLFVSGGNPALTPERATTWTASATVRPVEGLKLQASYFHVDYQDRISQPVSSYAGLLTNPVYASLISFSPSAATLSALIAGSGSGLSNLTPYPYDPANVVAVINGRFVNVSQQKMQGVDFDVEYSRDLSPRDRLSVSMLATYLDSNRAITATAPSVDAAGVVFSPPRWRARGGTTWQRRALTLSLFANYTDGVKDNRTTTIAQVDSLTSVDLTLRWKLPEGRSLNQGWTITASASNIFNAKPGKIRTTAAYYPAFDSTNYSAVGRFVSLTVSKSFR